LAFLWPLHLLRQSTELKMKVSVISGLAADIQRTWRFSDSAHMQSQLIRQTYSCKRQPSNSEKVHILTYPKLTPLPTCLPARLIFFKLVSIVWGQSGKGLKEAELAATWNQRKRGRRGKEALWAIAHGPVAMAFRPFDVRSVS
jgi:hypothetical protein